MASATPTKRQTSAKQVLTSRLQEHVHDLSQLAEWLKIDADFAVAAGESKAHDDIRLASVAVFNAVNALRATQAWRGGDVEWDLDDRVGLTEAYVDG